LLNTTVTVFQIHIPFDSKLNSSAFFWLENLVIYGVLSIIKIYC
jgi:hypothetical protein